MSIVRLSVMKCLAKNEAPQRASGGFAMIALGWNKRTVSHAAFDVSYSHGDFWKYLYVNL